MVLDLQVKIPLPEKIPVIPRLGLGLLDLTRLDKLGDLAGDTGRKGDKPPVEPGQKLLVHPGPVVKTLGIGKGTELHQVKITLPVGSQKHQMIVFIVAFRTLLLETGMGGNVNLAADNRLYRFLPLFVLALFVDRLLAGGQEFHNPEHIAMIRQSQVFHPQLLRPVRQTHHRHRGVLEGKIRMYMEMNKAAHTYR